MKKYFTVSFMASILSIVLSISVCANSENEINTDVVTDGQVTSTDISNEVVEEFESSESSNNDNKYYLAELEEVLADNRDLMDIYGTWTSVISITLIVVTIIGIAVPLYANVNVDRKIKKATDEIKTEHEKIMIQHVTINNALMLSASGDYWSSNEILRDILKEDCHNPYLHLLMGRNIFLQYDGGSKPPILDTEQMKDIEEAIDHYLFVANNSEDQKNYYSLGLIFPDSIVHELCMLMIKLIQNSIESDSSNYHKLTVCVITAIENILDIHKFDDIANEDQTNVHIMNYIILNHELAKSYEHFKNIKAKEQYEYTLKLYSISTELNYEDQIEECTQALERINNKKSS